MWEKARSEPWCRQLPQSDSEVEHIRNDSHRPSGEKNKSIGTRVRGQQEEHLRLGAMKRKNQWQAKQTTGLRVDKAKFDEKHTTEESSQSVPKHPRTDTDVQQWC